MVLTLREAEALNSAKCEGSRLLQYLLDYTLHTERGVIHIKYWIYDVNTIFGRLLKRIRDQK